MLWHISVLWWARLAKIAGLLGGLIILLDILGEKRIRETADQSGRGAKAVIVGTWRVMVTYWKLLIMPCAFFMGGVGWLSHFIAVDFATGWVGMLFYILSSMLGYSLLAAVSVSIVFGLIRLPLWWLSRPYMAHSFRVFALAMLLLAFMMDMAVN